MLTAKEARMIADKGHEQAVYTEIDRVLEQIKGLAEEGLYKMTLNGELYKETTSALKELGYKIKIRDRFQYFSTTIISWEKE